MAHLRVAHLAVGQTDCHAGGVNGGHGVFCHQGIDEGLVGCGHGVAVGLVGGPAKAIHDTEQNRFLGHKNESPLKVQQTAPGSMPEMRRSRAQGKCFFVSAYAQPLEAALTMTAKSGAFRDAPPMRPPSTSFLLSSSSQFLAFMLPPYWTVVASATASP